MDCLYVLQDLEAAGTKLRSPFLHHLFRNFSPSRSNTVQDAIIAFHSLDVNVGYYDYRAARHQFSDWLFGWNVSELSDTVDTKCPILSNNHDPSIKGANNISGNTFGILRSPREIDFFDKSERLECEKLVEAFTVQYNMGMRKLHQLSLRLEERLPLIGKNLACSDNKANAGINDNADSIWGSDIVENSSKIENQPPIETSNNSSNVNTTTDAQPANPFPEKPVLSIDSDHGDKNGQVANKLDTTQHKSKSIRTARKRSSIRFSLDQASNIQAKDGDFNAVLPLPEIRTKSALKTSPENINPDETSNATDTSNPVTSTKPTIHSIVDSSVPDDTPTNPDVAPNPKEKQIKENSMLNTNAIIQSNLPNHQEIIKNDIDLLFLDLSMTLDLYIACIISIIVVLALADLLVNKELYTKFASHAQNLCLKLISTGIRVVWDLIKRAYIPTDGPTLTAAQLSDLKALEKVMIQILKTRTYKPTDAIYLALSRMHAKFAVLHKIFVGVDVFLFPQMVPAHSSISGCLSIVNASNTGVKSMAPTIFDKQIWVTGGYDCKVRIWDMIEGTCLSQFSGHRSIVTEVQFVKQDTFILSSSFDKTIKVWNAQTGSCERTFTGHSDSITTFDVSPDTRYVLSGGLDNTLKLWDFYSGHCISTTKKHTKYIKCLKFSPDNRYAASAGLDCLVYIWDVKILANSKDIVHARCIEAHNDYVLALDMQRPSLLVTTSRDTKLKLWDYLSGHCLFTVSLAPAWSCSVVFGHDAELVAAGCSDNSIHIFRTKTFERVRVLKALNSGVLSVRFPKKDYEFIMVGTSEGFLQKLLL